MAQQKLSVLFREGDASLATEVTRSMRWHGITVNEAFTDPGAWAFLHAHRSTPYAAFRTFTHLRMSHGKDVSGYPDQIAQTFLENPDFFDACSQAIVLSSISGFCDNIRRLVADLMQQYPKARIFPLNRDETGDGEASESAFWEKWAASGGTESPEQMKRFLLDL